MANHRWIKFWPQDWRGDPALRSCSVAARGLWIDLLCVAHESEPYGHVLINGKPLTIRQIGTITGTGEKEAGRLLEELEGAGVFSRSPDGAIVSRRMVKDGAVSEAGRKAVKKRWGDTNGNTDPGSPPNRGPISDGNSLESESESDSDSYDPDDQPKRATTRKRRTQVTPDWTPDVDGFAYAEERGVIPGSEIAPFRNHHTAKGSLMADWSAAWRTWCDNAVRYGRAPGKPVSDHPSTLFEGVHGDDSWGLRAWTACQHDAKLTDCGDGRQAAAINGFEVELLGTNIAEAASLPSEWRGSWDALGGWLRNEVEITAETLAAVSRQAARMRSKGETINSIKVFDTVVRGAARVAA
jgi:hypothetical protein